MGMSLQKKFICGLTSFVLFIGLVGFIIGFFARPSKNCGGAKNGNDDAVGMLTLQKEALEQVVAQRIRDFQKHFTNESLDITGTNDSCKHAYFIEKEWNSLGLNTVEVKRYDVLFSYPKKPRELSLVDETGQVVSSSIFVKRGIHDLGGVPFSTYSTSGVAMGKLLYVNYGRENDFKYLDDSNISSTGKLVLLRYGKILESAKIANAQKWNTAGVLLYLDPADSGYDATNSTSKKVMWYAGDTADWVNRGDPLTPGYPATAGIFREPVKNILRKFPIQPIPSGEAEMLLRLLNHTLVPAHWQGGLDFQYGIQMDPNDTRNVRLNVSLTPVKRSVCSVVGTIKGNKEPDRYVLVGSPHPFGGTAVLMEVARILLSIKRKGWLPRRTIKICSWGSGNTGAVEWIEEYERVLEARAVAYLNVESSVQDLNMGVSAHYLLEKTVFNAAKMGARSSSVDRFSKHEQNQMLKEAVEGLLVKVGGSSSESLYDEWKKAGSLPINTESACFPFAYKTGVPCVSVVYQAYNASSSISSPGNFKTHVALAQVWLQMAFDIAGSILIPFNVEEYAKALCTFTEKLSASYCGTLKRNNITLDFLIKGAEEFQQAAQAFQDCLRAVDKDNLLQVRMFNDRIMQLERAFINKEVFPGRPSARHVVFAPSYFPTSPDIKFTGITDSIHIAQNTNRENEWQRVRKQISMAIHAFRSAVSLLQPPDF